MADRRRRKPNAEKILAAFGFGVPQGPPRLDLGVAGLDLGSSAIDTGGSALDLGGEADPASEFNDDDPLRDVNYTDNFEQDSAAEIETVKTAAYKALADSNRAIRDAVTYDYMVIVVFQTENQRNAFIEASGLTAEERTYVDGRELAARMGIAIDGTPIEFRASKPDRMLGALPVIGEKK